MTLQQAKLPQSQLSLCDNFPYPNHFPRNEIIILRLPPNPQTMRKSCEGNYSTPHAKIEDSSFNVLNLLLCRVELSLLADCLSQQLQS